MGAISYPLTIPPVTRAGSYLRDPSLVISVHSGLNSVSGSAVQAYKLTCVFSVCAQWEMRSLILIGFV